VQVESPIRISYATEWQTPSRITCRLPLLIQTNKMVSVFESIECVWCCASSDDNREVQWQKIKPKREENASLAQIHKYNTA